MTGFINGINFETRMTGRRWFGATRGQCMRVERHRLRSSSNTCLAGSNLDGVYCRRQPRLQNVSGCIGGHARGTDFWQTCPCIWDVRIRGVFLESGTFCRVEGRQDSQVGEVAYRLDYLLHAIRFKLFNFLWISHNGISEAKARRDVPWLKLWIQICEKRGLVMQHVYKTADMSPFLWFFDS